MKICMFVKNSFEYDARVTKEARTLIGAGHEVTVVALHVPNLTIERETTADGIRVIRVQRFGFGVGRFSRAVAGVAGRAIVQQAKVAGEEVDPDLFRRATAIRPPSTATPGENQTIVRVAEPRVSDSDRRPPAARVRLILALVGAARFGYRLALSVFGLQGRAVKTYAINRRLIEAGLSTQADVYHSHDLNTLWVGHVCKRRTGARLVYDSHELATERNRMGRWWKATATWTERRWLPSADALIMASPPWIDHNRRKYGRVPEPAVAVLNVPELQTVTPVDLRSLLDIEASQAILLYQGSIQENRGIEPAIEALAFLPKAVVVVIGYGHHRPVLERMDHGNRVRFFGPVPNHELLDYTAGADIGLCNIVSSSISYHTSLPNKLFEYLMAGIPVIGCEGPEIARVVRLTGAGEVAPATDPRALAAAAEKILADPDHYRAAARAARTSYHWGVEAAKLLEVYREIGS